MQQFHASQTLKMSVPNQAKPIEHYLRQPQRLVHAITDASRMEALGDSIYRLSLRPLRFMSLKFEPIADLKVIALTDGTLSLEALDCQIRGADALNRSFAMQLQGSLSPQRQGDCTELTGKADMTVWVEVPPPLHLMPQSVLVPAGQTFLSGLLQTIKHRIERQLVRDYRVWAREAADTAENIPSVAMFGGSAAR